MKCESCGMPMGKPEDYGAGKVGNKYCRYCTDPKGNLKSREEVRRGWAQFVMKTTGKSQEEAEKSIDAEMKRMPAWKS
ncbi:hypothetical protein A3K63_04650 [Candidatus Micrarchaeota archaeon RBG_16_49_10]|nr:MAG: hypothetical protein A3K63_04650 [Candidatus Micrarchaeota archaeon RBG_16_49_10]